MLGLLQCQNGGHEFFFNFMDKPIDDDIESSLNQLEYEKRTIYFDNISQREGRWEVFPWTRLNKDLIAINVSKIPNTPESYNFLILYCISQKKVIQTEGPFYDSEIMKIVKMDVDSLAVYVQNETEKKIYMFHVPQK